MKIGLLLESAHTHQTLAEAALERLHLHARDMDAVVREEIRHTLVEELQSLSVESQRALQALRGLQHGLAVRIASCSLLTAGVCAAISLLLVWSLVPTPAQIAALRTQRDALASTIAQLRTQGGGLDLRRCGAPAHLCVRVDRQARAFGEHADYFIVESR